MPRTHSASPSIPTLEHCNLDHDADFPPLYFSALERRSELPRTYPHRHSYFHLFWVTEGAGRHMIDFCDHPVQDRSVFIVAPGQIHFWAVEPQAQGFLFNFNAEIFDGHGSSAAAAYDERLRLRLQANPAFYPDADQAEAISRLVELIAAEYRQPARGGTEIVTHLFQVLLLRILRIEQAHTAEAGHQASALGQRFALQVERRFLQGSTVAEYAAALCVSERTLAEATKRATGKTPKELILDRLLLEAKRLLLHSTMAVAEIAFHLNFEDPAYFGRFFRRRTGMAPGEFKRVTRESGGAPLRDGAATQKCHAPADSS